MTFFFFLVLMRERNVEKKKGIGIKWSGEYSSRVSSYGRERNEEGEEVTRIRTHACGLLKDR